jgi:hypothetical protein
MTLAQMTLFLREGQKLQQRQAAKHAQLTRAAVWAEQDAFDKLIDGLEG